MCFVTRKGLYSDTMNARTQVAVTEGASTHPPQSFQRKSGMATAVKPVSMSSGYP